MGSGGPPRAVERYEIVAFFMFSLFIISFFLSFFFGCCDTAPLIDDASAAPHLLLLLHHHHHLLLLLLLFPAFFFFFLFFFFFFFLIWLSGTATIHLLRLRRLTCFTRRFSFFFLSLSFSRAIRFSSFSSLSFHRSFFLLFKHTHTHTHTHTHIFLLSLCVCVCVFCAFLLRLPTRRVFYCYGCGRTHHFLFLLVGIYGLDAVCRLAES